MSESDRTPTAAPAAVSDTVTATPDTAPQMAEVGTLLQSPADAARILAGVSTIMAHVPGYEILGKLGQGAMGVVYKARQIHLNRVVALKMVLATGPVARNELLRFLAEAESVAAVKHENVVQVHESGECSGQPYMVLEYLSGGTLANVLEKTVRETGSTSRSFKGAAQLVGRIARGVAAAHAQGIVHRDLKPANVLFDEAGTPKVADFGLAKRDGNSEITQTGQVMGTPTYMSPEQAKGDTKFVGPQADVWALGVILYESLTGRRPFTADNQLELMLKIGLDDPIPPRRVVPSLPRDLELICLKCLSKQPHERYPTAKELADDLDLFARGESIAARPVGFAERLVRWARRKPAAASAYGFSSLAVLLAVLVFVVFGFYREAERAKDVAETAKGEAEGAKDEAVVLRLRAEGLFKDADTARAEERRLKGVAETALRGETAAKKESERQREILARIEYGRTVQIAYQVWKDNRVVEARALLDGTDPVLRGWEYDYVHRLCHADLVTLKGHAGKVRFVSFSPDGAKVLAIGETAVRVCDAVTGKTIAELNGNASAAFFNHDGTRVVTSGTDRMACVWDAANGKQLATLKGHMGAVWFASFSRDGTKVVTGDDSRARVWDVATAQQLVETEVCGRVQFVSLSPDGSKVLTAGNGAPARVWDVANGKRIAELRHPGAFHAFGEVTSAAFSPDGSKVVTGSYDPEPLRDQDMTACVWDAATGKQLATLKGHARGVMTVSFNRDGSQVVTAGEDGTARVWDAGTGKPLVELKSHAGMVASASFNHDGKRVVTSGADGTVRVWDAATGKPLATLTGHMGAVWFASFNTNGTRVATVGHDGTIRVWNATDPKATELKGHTGLVTSAAFSPTGTRVVTGSADGTARVWDVASRQLLGRPLIVVDGLQSVVTSASFNYNGSQVVTARTKGGAVRYSEVVVWRLADGWPVADWKGHAEVVRSAVFSPDGSKVLLGGGDVAQVCDAGPRKDRTDPTREPLVELTGHTDTVTSASFTSKGTRVLTSSKDGTVRVWDTATGKQLSETTLHGSKASFGSFSRDGSKVVTAGVDATARMWDTASGKPLIELKGHTDRVTSAAFHRDGNRVVTSSADGTVRVWDTHAGAELLALPGGVV
ncbi:MAG TPA: protein kinase, partial [Gemmata sp.]